MTFPVSFSFLFFFFAIESFPPILGVFQDSFMDARDSLHSSMAQLFPL